MVEPPKVYINCGKIYILDNDIFSLICEFCGEDFCALEDFRAHLTEHFPATPTNINNEDSISCDSDCVYVSEEIPDNLQEPEAGVIKDSIPSTINDEEAIKSEHNEEPQTEMRYENDTENTSKPRTQNLVPLTASAGMERDMINKLRLECSFCRKIFKRNMDLNAHENTHTGRQPYKCPTCPRTFACRSNLAKHIKTHTGDHLQHKCKACERRFGSKFMLGNHEREHLPDTDPWRYFPCKLCNTKFKTFAQLSYHRQKKHKKNPAIFICNYCQHKFHMKADIYQHMRAHSGKCN